MGKNTSTVPPSPQVNNNKKKLVVLVTCYSAALTLRSYQPHAMLTYYDLVNIELYLGIVEITYPKCMKFQL